MTDHTDNAYNLTPREIAFFNRLSSVMDVLFMSATAILPMAVESVDVDKITKMKDVPNIYFKNILDNNELPLKIKLIGDRLNQYVSGFCFSINYNNSHDVIDLFFTLKTKNDTLTIRIYFTPHTCLYNKVYSGVYVSDNDNKTTKLYDLWMRHRIGKRPISGFITNNDCPKFNQIILNMFHRTLKEIRYSNVEEGIKHTVDVFRLLCD